MSTQLHFVLSRENAVPYDWLKFAVCELCAFQKAQTDVKLMV